MSDVRILRWSIDMIRFSGFSVLAVLFVGLTVPAVAGSLSFTGNFVNDNDVQLLNFDVLVNTTVTLQTFGYGGGTNANGDVILPGGFESILQVFASPSGLAVGGPILPGPNPTCGPRTPDPNRLNFCFDAYAQVILTAGDYQVALTQSPNVANGSNLSDGFFYDSDPNFNNGFVGTFDFQGDSHWAVDIITGSPVAAAPEPRSALLAASAFLLVGLAVRKRAR
jgi:hypothetical protein